MVVQSFGWRQGEHLQAAEMLDGGTMPPLADLAEQRRTARCTTHDSKHGSDLFISKSFHLIVLGHSRLWLTQSLKALNEAGTTLSTVLKSKGT